MSWSFAPTFLSYCHFPLFHLKSMEYQNDFSGTSVPPVALSPWFHRLSAACISGIVSATVECSIGPGWMRSVLSMNEYLMNLMWSPLIDALNAAPKPSCHSKSRIGVLTTTQICGPAPFPCLMPKTGTAQISVPAHTVESPYSVHTW